MNYFFIKQIITSNVIDATKYLKKLKEYTSKYCSPSRVNTKAKAQNIIVIIA